MFKNKWDKNKFIKAINKPTRATEVELKKIQTTNIKSKYATVIVLTRRLSYSEELVIHLSGNLSQHRHPVLHTQHGLQTRVVLDTPVGHRMNLAG